MILRILCITALYCALLLPYAQGAFAAGKNAAQPTAVQKKSTEAGPFAGATLGGRKLWTPDSLAGNWAALSDIQKAPAGEQPAQPKYGGLNPLSLAGDVASSKETPLQRPADHHSGLVTGVNSRLFAPLGPFQLSVASGGAKSKNPAGETGYSETFTFGDFGLSPSAGVYWHSDRDAAYFSGASGLGDGQGNHETAQDYSPYIGLTLDLNINGNWSAFLNGEVAFPGDKIRDNQAMDGSSTQSVTTGIVYTFW